MHFARVEGSGGLLNIFCSSVMHYLHSVSPSDRQSCSPHTYRDERFMYVWLFPLTNTMVGLDQQSAPKQLIDEVPSHVVLVDNKVDVHVLWLAGQMILNKLDQDANPFADKSLMFCIISQRITISMAIILDISSREGGFIPNFYKQGKTIEMVTPRSWMMYKTYSV